MPINDIQTTNRQHAVPQNIMDVEFKIIGDLTMRQFFYLALFSAIAYASFTTFNNPVFKYPISMISALIGLGFAFVPIEEGTRSMDSKLYKSSIRTNTKNMEKRTYVTKSIFI